MLQSPELQNIQLVNEREAARMLAVSVAALRRWRRENRGPAFTRCEACIRYDVRQLEKFLQQNSSVTAKAVDRESAARREVRSANATARR